MNYALKIQRAFRRFIKERENKEETLIHFIRKSYKGIKYQLTLNSARGKYKIEAECKEFGTKYYTLKNKEVVYLFKKKIDI